jgi:hypothetical protein
VRIPPGDPLSQDPAPPQARKALRSTTDRHKAPAHEYNRASRRLSPRLSGLRRPPIADGASPPVGDIRREASLREARIHPQTTRSPEISGATESNELMLTPVVVAEDDYQAAISSQQNRMRRGDVGRETFSAVTLRCARMPDFTGAGRPDILVDTRKS